MKQAEKKTNVIYIVLDDMGYSDLGCFGAEVKTPNIDELAKDGLIYNNFAVCPASSPTRASLLTGRDNNAVGMGSIANMVFPPDRPDTQGRICPEAGTIAEVLRENGYSTFACGKWHVAPLYHETPVGPFDFWPLGKGFQRYYGFLEGETDQYAPQLVYDNHSVKPPVKEGYHLSEDLADKSIEFVSDQVSIFPNMPFFLYLCFGVAHSPHQVPKKYIERYKGLYDKGWDAIREERFRRQIALGIIPEGTQLTERDPAVQRWDELDEERRQLYVRFQETYAGFITHCDEQVGRLTAFLKEIGEFDDSIIVLFSDNGASRDGGTEGVDDFIRTLNGSSPSFEELFGLIDDIGGPEVKALYPKGWASVSNTPFKEYKGSNYGGGMRTPMIFHWGNGIRERGQIRSQFTHVCDVTPTVFDILGITPPTTIKGVGQMPLNGHSFAATLNDRDAAPCRSGKFYLWANTRGMVTPEWKAVSLHHPGKPFEQDTWDLYHLSEDFAEARNVASEYPEVLEELKALWDQEAAKCLTHPMMEVRPEDRAYQPDDCPSNGSYFRYLPHMGHLGCSADPVIENRSHVITVPIQRECTSEEGVLVASGGNCGGYSLYIMNNKLYYCFNNFRHYYMIESEREVPAGAVTVRFAFESFGKIEQVESVKEGAVGAFYDAGGKCPGIGRLFIDDKEVGNGPIDSVSFGLSLEGFDIGCDMLTPVSPMYKDKGDFAFTGTIKEVIFQF